MATSGVATYNPNMATVLKRALRLVGAYSSLSQPTANQLNAAKEALNMMLKAWQVEGLIWLCQFVTVSLVVSQQTYLIGPNSTDAMVDEDGDNFRTRPFRILDIARKTGNNEVSLTPLTRKEYMELSNKSSTGTVIQYYYDPQITDGKLYVWPTSINTTDTLVLSVERAIEDMLADTNDFDLPVEWMEAVSYGLAYRLAGEYRLPMNEREMLLKEAAILKEQLLASCRENVPARFVRG